MIPLPPDLHYELCRRVRHDYLDAIAPIVRQIIRIDLAVRTSIIITGDNVEVIKQPTPQQTEALKLLKEMQERCLTDVCRHHNIEPAYIGVSAA